MFCRWVCLYSIVDIRGLSQLAHRYGALLSVDNTMMSPYLQKVSWLAALSLTLHNASSRLVLSSWLIVLCSLLMYGAQPLQLGADIVMHSATKFISGHSDVMAGVLAVDDPVSHLTTTVVLHPCGTITEHVLLSSVAG